MDRLRIEGRVDGAKEGHDVRVRVADAADFEVIAVNVNDVDVVRPDADLAEISQIPASTLEELEGRLDRAVLMDSKRFGHELKPDSKPRDPRPWAYDVISATPPVPAAGASF